MHFWFSPPGQPACRYELFYQQVLRFFGRLQSFQLSPPLPVSDLLQAALEDYGLPSELKTLGLDEVLQVRRIHHYGPARQAECILRSEDRRLVA